MQKRRRASLLACGAALGLALLVPTGGAPAHGDALCDAMKARFGPGYPCLNVPTNTFTPTAPTAPATTEAGGTSGGGPQAGSNIGPGPGEGNGTPIVPVPGQTPAAATPSQPQQTPVATTPPQTAPSAQPAATPAPSTRSQAAFSSATPSAPTSPAIGQAGQSSADTPSLAAEGTGSTTPWWPIGAALAIAALALLGIGALIGARRGLFGSPFTLLTPSPASAVTHPRPPQYDVPPEATAPAVQYHEPDTNNSATTEGGGSGPDTSSGGQSGGAGTTYNDPPTDSGTYGGGTGTGTTGGGTTGTGTGSGGPSNGSTSPATQAPPPQTTPTTPPPSADDPARAQTVGFFTDILKPIIASAEAAAALAALTYALSQLVIQYGREWLRQHPLETNGLLASQLPAWVIARIGDLDHAITQFFADNNDDNPIHRPNPKHNRSIPSRGRPKDAAPLDLTDEEAQQVLDDSIPAPKGKSRWGIKDGKIYEFKPEGNDNAYHGYLEKDPNEVPSNVIKQWEKQGKISQALKNKWLSGKNRGGKKTPGRRKGK